MARGSRAAAQERPRPFRCPICGTRLAEGQTVRTAAYPGDRERLVYIYGCPHCYGTQASLERKCPVCRARLVGDEYLVGRLIRGDGRSRVRVWGCSRCSGPERRPS